jgi:hypothetical protein
VRTQPGVDSPGSVSIKINYPSGAAQLTSSAGPALHPACVCWTRPEDLADLFLSKATTEAERRSSSRTEVDTDSLTISNGRPGTASPLPVASCTAWSFPANVC